MMSLFDKDSLEKNQEPIRFTAPESEDDEAFDIEKRCAKDLANFINGKGGLQFFMTNCKLERFMCEMKAQMFI